MGVGPVYGTAGVGKPERLTEAQNKVKFSLPAEVAEQADALRSGRSGLYARVGSTPTFGTLKSIIAGHLARNLHGP